MHISKRCADFVSQFWRCVVTLWPQSYHGSKKRNSFKIFHLCEFANDSFCYLNARLETGSLWLPIFGDCYSFKASLLFLSLAPHLSKMKRISWSSFLWGSKRLNPSKLLPLCVSYPLSPAHSLNTKSSPCAFPSCLRLFFACMRGLSYKAWDLSRRSHSCFLHTAALRCQQLRGSCALQLTFHASSLHSRVGNDGGKDSSLWNGWAGNPSCLENGDFMFF